MTDEKWEVLVETIQTAFPNAKVSNEVLTVRTQEGPVEQGNQDIVEFHNASGYFKVVRENKPAILDKKSIYSHRAGDTAHNEYTYSDTEFSHKLRVFKEVDIDDWEEVTLDKLGL